MKDSRLVIGMPAGSLANPSRGGNLIELLDKSGFRTKGYDAGGPTSFETAGFLFGWDGRPQEFGSQLAAGELDVAIAGDDWIRERQLEMRIQYRREIALQKVLPLNRGSVRLVGIIPGDNPAETAEEFIRELSGRKPLITLVSELPFLALDWVTGILRQAGNEEAAASWSVQKYNSPPLIDRGILIYETWGKTEAKVKNGGADLGLEITQSGSALRNYGLKIIDEIMTSETGIWINPEILDDPEKKDLLSMFLLNLYGTLHAENKLMLMFNVPKESRTEVDRFLKDHNLFADEPTHNPGEKYEQYSIQVDTERMDIPLARVRYELAKKGARSIDTIPLLSSIPHGEVIRLERL